ncbi:Avirulence protein (Avh) [Phytophthora palmivora]|uniref:Avirulence protein (Avh) n=1 Tax=Phytophthora palmivora TaxID=4796 RepID=A0A2P4YCW6_9STRA|nr:Avirulence protein (Avh) [Phytophthora palmivora]
MRPYYIILVGAVALLTPAASTSIERDSKVTSVLALPFHRDTNRFLRIHYDDDEERAFGIKSIPGVDKFSSYLSKQKLAKYLKNDKDTDAVFAKLRLNTAGEKLFENPKFLDWVKYVDDYNDKNPHKAKSMLPTLVNQYNDETLSKMLEAAKQVESTNSIATRLQTEQMTMWKRADITADKLFQIYRLHDGVPAYPAINIWMRYADEFAPGTKTTLFETLQKHYSDNALSQVVIAMMKVPSTEKLAVDLQKQQIRLWLDKLESPENVFKLLMLDKGADNLLANPQFKVWTGYALEFQKHAKGTQMIDTLMKNYTPQNMATVINTAKKNPNTKRMAQYVQSELLGKWAAENKPLADVLKLLGTSADEVKLVKTLYTAKVEKIKEAQKQQIRVWLDKMVPPENVFKILKLDKEADNLLTNPQLKVWIEYASKFKDHAQGNPFATQSNMIDTLMRNYNAKDLATIINTAKKNPNTKRVAEDIQDELIGKWVLDGKPLTYVSKMLGTSKEEAVLVHKIYMAKIKKILVD